MGGGSSSGGGGCAYKNQGENIHELKQQIYTHITATEAKLEKVKNLVNANNTKFVNARDDALKIYNELDTKYNGVYDDYDGNIKKLRQDISGINSELLTVNNNINSTQNQINEVQRNINGVNTNINNDNNDINKKYQGINNLINDGITANQTINAMKDENFIKSNSIAYFENLVFQAYKEIYGAVKLENNALVTNKDMRADNYSIDNSSFVYQKNRIQTFKNINTFLFYFYYVMIIVLIIVVLKYNTSSLLVKFTFFRVFAILLILYPLFIIRFQQFIYRVIKQLSTNIYSAF
jgi:predicted  nucleic acid-binding Zn-ribbon protein